MQTFSSLPGNAPAVSVIVASYNYAQYIEEAVRSVLLQTCSDLEVVVVDDGSTDSSPALLHKLAAEDPRVRVLFHADGGNHGLPATLQRGLAEAKGQWVAFLESDDVWHPTCLAARLSCLEKTSTPAEVCAIFNAIEALPMPGADTSWFDGYVPRVMQTHARRGTAPFRLETSLLFENAIPTFSCAMIRKETLVACDFAAPVPRWLDWWLWMQVALRGTFVFVPEQLTQWRLHAASYNHTVVPTGYRDDIRAQWIGFRQIFKEHTEQTLLANLLLRLPYLTPAAVRLCRMATQGSPMATFRRIRSRINQTNP